MSPMCPYLTTTGIDPHFFLAKLILGKKGITLGLLRGGTAKVTGHWQGNAATYPARAAHGP